MCIHMCVRAFIDRDKNNYYLLQYLPVRGPLSAVSVPTSSPLFCPAATTIASQQELGRKKPLTRVFLKREKKKIRQKFFLGGKEPKKKKKEGKESLKEVLSQAIYFPPFL
jgi:hypothetical protein